MTAICSGPAVNGRCGRPAPLIGPDGSRLCRGHWQQLYLGREFHAITRDNRTEDAGWLLDSGESPESVSARLALTPNALYKRMRRIGHPRLGECARARNAARRIQAEK